MPRDVSSRSKKSSTANNLCWFVVRRGGPTGNWALSSYERRNSLSPLVASDNNER